MSRGTNEGATVLITSAVVIVMVLIGLITFGVADELKKARQMSGLTAADEFDPNSLPAPAAGILKQERGNSLGCDGVIFSAADNGTRYVRESGGGIYYAAEVNSVFDIYTLSYGHLVNVEHSSLDTHTYRKLKNALYHCDGSMTESGVHIAENSPEDPQV